MTRLSLWRDTASTYTIMMGVVGEHTSFPFYMGISLLWYAWAVQFAVAAS